MTKSSSLQRGEEQSAPLLPRWPMMARFALVQGYTVSETDPEQQALKDRNDCTPLTLTGKVGEIPRLETAIRPQKSKVQWSPGEVTEDTGTQQTHRKDALDLGSPVSSQAHTWTLCLHRMHTFLCTLEKNLTSRPHEGFHSYHKRQKDRGTREGALQRPAHPWMPATAGAGQKAGPGAQPN